MEEALVDWINPEILPDDPEMKFAVKKGNVEKVRELLSHGADLKHLKKFGQKLWRTPMTPNHVEIIRLFVEAGAVVDRRRVQEFLAPPCSKYATEIFTKVLNCTRDLELLHVIFDELAHFSDRPKALEILDLLIDRGFPVNGLYKYRHYVWQMNQAECAPLHHAIACSNADFIVRLIQKRADVEKRTEDNGYTPLALAVLKNDPEKVETLLKHGAKVNGKTSSYNTDFEDVTALHVTTHGRCDILPGRDKVITVLFKYGADINALDENGRTPAQYANLNDKETVNRTVLVNKYMFVKELARLTFEKRYICQQNLDYLEQHGSVKRCFKNSLEELKKMKSLEFYNEISFYDVLQMRSKEKKLISLTRNEDFVSAFDSWRDSESFECYGEELDDMFEQALKKRDILLAEEKKLQPILKNYFPELIIRIVASFSVN